MWKAVHVGVEGDDLMIGGRPVWSVKWRDTGETVQLPHPSYPNQSHRYRVYEINGESHQIRFAAGELSNGVFGFYVPL